MLSIATCASLLKLLSFSTRERADVSPRPAETTPVVVDGVRLNRRHYYEIEKVDFCGRWLMLKTSLTASVILSALALGSPHATAKSNEPPHTLGGQNSELEETI